MNIVRLTGCHGQCSRPGKAPHYIESPGVIVTFIAQAQYNPADQVSLTLAGPDDKLKFHLIFIIWLSNHPPPAGVDIYETIP